MRLILGILATTLLMVPRTSAAQAPNPYGPPKPPRVFVDVNLLGVTQPLGRERVFETSSVKFGEIATFKATYPEPSESGVYPAYLGGGFMFSPKAGIGVSYSHMSWESVATLAATVPDPAFFNAPANDTGNTGTTLSREESAVHISLTLVPYRTNRMELRLTGGPTYFMFNAEMVREVGYEQIFNPAAPQNTVNINGFSGADATGNQWGFHAGVDFTYFVHRLVGVAGGVRFAEGIVDVDEPLSKIQQQFRVGSTTVFLGLRFRLGRTHVD